MREFGIAAHDMPSVETKIPNTGATLGVAAAVGHAGRGVIAFGVLVMGSASTLQAQIGLSSAPASITLLARAAPAASIVGVTPVRETARRGGTREETVGVRLSANTSYRLMVVGTGPASLPVKPASRVWVQAEGGPFVEVGAGAAVTVARGRHAAAEEARVVFRSDHSGSAQQLRVLPVRYELRIDPTI